MKTIKYYHKNSDVVAFKKETYSNGYSCERTYDENGNQLTYKDSFNYSEEHTYDENGNQLTYKDSDGYSCERTYDENGNVLTFKNSKGYFRIKGKQVTEEEFEAFIHNQNRPLVGKKVLVDGAEYELK